MHAHLLEGQKQAKRLAKNINKEDINVRSLLKHYNWSVEVLHQHGSSEMRELTWEELATMVFLLP